MESIISVIPKSNYLLELKFSTGELRMFDAAPCLEKGVFKKLKNVALFNQAYIAYDTVCWPDNLDISHETLYLKSIKI